MRFCRTRWASTIFPALVEAALETVEQVSAPTLEEILAADHAARKAVRAHIQ